MKALLLIIFAFALPQTLVADDHLSQTNVAAVWECTFKGDTTAGDIAAWGSSDFKKWVGKNNLRVGSYLWEAVAVNAPFDEADVRWVDYYPSWEDFYEVREAWEKSGSLAKDYDSMVTCGKPRFAVGMRMGGPAPQAKQKPLVANVCQLNEGKTMQDVMTFAPKATALINETVGAEITSFVWTNFIGVSGLDYIAFFTGETGEMTKVMDGVKNGVIANRFAKAGISPPGTCVVDLNHSHEMVRATN